MIPILDTHYNAKIHKKSELLSGSCPQPEISNLEDVSCSHHADMGGRGGRGCIYPPPPPCTQAGAEAGDPVGRDPGDFWD